MDKNISLQQRRAIAAEGRRNGYNCTQAVAAAFPDVMQLPSDVVLRLSTGFGGGFGGMQKVCGVMSAMTMLEGFRHTDGVKGKAEVYKAVRNLGDRFRNACGSLDCAELKKPGAAISCNEIIDRGIEIYHNHLAGK